MLYIFVDTNIWIRLLSQGRPGCEPAHFQELEALVASDKAILVLPEIIELELEKQWREYGENIVKRIEQLKAYVEKQPEKETWNETDDVKRAVSDLLEKKKEEKKIKGLEHYRQIKSLFSSPKIIKLDFTEDIFLLGHKRLMAGRFPIADPNRQNRSNDACLIEALVRFFRDRRDDEAKLYFCSENAKDFAVITESAVYLHPLIQPGLPLAQYFLSLREMTEFHQRGDEITEPPQREVEQAVEHILEQDARAENEKHTPGLCVVEGCSLPKWFIAPYCGKHFDEHLRTFSTHERNKWSQTLESVLKTITYKEREIIKLRYGLGDGYIYTLQECGRIFKLTPQQIRNVELKALRKLLHPVRFRQLEAFF